MCADRASAIGAIAKNKTRLPITYTTVRLVADHRHQNWVKKNNVLLVLHAPSAVTGQTFLTGHACRADCEGKFCTRSSGGALRRALFKLERGVCTNCHLDCHSLVTNVRCGPATLRNPSALQCIWCYMIQDTPNQSSWLPTQLEVAAEADALPCEEALACGMERILFPANFLTGVPTTDNFEQSGGKPAIIGAHQGCNWRLVLSSNLVCLCVHPEAI